MVQHLSWLKAGNDESTGSNLDPELWKDGKFKCFIAVYRDIVAVRLFSIKSSFEII